MWGKNDRKGGLGRFCPKETAIVVSFNVNAKPFPSCPLERSQGAGERRWKTPAPEISHSAPLSGREGDMF